MWNCVSVYLLFWHGLVFHKPLVGKRLNPDWNEHGITSITDWLCFIFKLTKQWTWYFKIIRPPVAQNRTLFLKVHEVVWSLLDLPCTFHWYSVVWRTEDLISNMGAAFSIISVLFAFKGDHVFPLTSMEFIPPIANLLALTNKWTAFMFHLTETSK